MTRKQKTRQDFLGVVEKARKAIGSRDPARITDHMLMEFYAHTRIAAKSEGIYACLRDGMIKHVKEQIRKVIDGSQADFAAYCVGFESRCEHLPVGQLIKEIALLDEARKFHRSKGEETLRESDMLDDLYKAVMRAERKRLRPQPVAENPYV